jgi:hypothetical protein
VTLAEHTIHEDAPSKFISATGRTEAIATSALMTEEMAHGQGEAFLGDEEGKRWSTSHVTYERSPRNRSEAIRIHGTKVTTAATPPRARPGERRSDGRGEGPATAPSAAWRRGAGLDQGDARRGDRPVWGSRGAVVGPAGPVVCA